MARFTGGWIKLYRTVLEKEEIADDLELCGIWMNLLLMANYKETKKDWGKEIRTLPPGDILLGIKELSTRWKLSRDTILRRLRYLEKWGCIRVETAERGTIVTICNWREYQDDSENVAEDVRDICVTDAEDVRKSPTLSKEVKKERRKERKKTNVGIRLDYPPEFNAVWEKYGRRGDKKEAYKVYRELTLAESEAPLLDLAIQNYLLENPESKYRLHFVRFLRTDWREKTRPLVNSNGHDANYFDFLHED